MVVGRMRGNNNLHLTVAYIAEQLSHVVIYMFLFFLLIK